MRFVRSDSLDIFCHQTLQDIFSISDRVFGFSGMVRPVSDSKIFLDQYVLDCSVPDTELLGQILSVQKMDFSFDLFATILSTVRIVGWLNKDGFSNIFLLKNHSGQTNIVTIELKPFWYEAGGRTIKIENLYFKVNLAENVTTWHPGNNVFVLNKCE